MSWLGKLFGKKEAVLEPINLGQLKVDFHSHLIPAIDDGSKSLEDSMEMLTKFESWGYDKVITTPHVMSDFYRNTPEIILGGRDEVRNELKKKGSQLGFEAAAEYYLDETLEDKVKAKEILTFGDKHVLFELPFIAEPPNLASVIFEMQTQGYKPILAHPERYGFWYNDFEKFREMKDKGVFLQVNILSFIGHYSPETQKIAERLVDEDLISFLGTDCHNQGHQQLIEIARTKPYVHKLIESGKLLNHTL